MSVIKSIQRGVHSGNGTVNINPVNPDKSIILLNSGVQSALCMCGQASTANSGSGAYVQDFSNTSFSINGAVLRGFYSNMGNLYETGLDLSVSWQVIEFK